MPTRKHFQPGPQKNLFLDAPWLVIELGLDVGQLCFCHQYFPPKMILASVHLLAAPWRAAAPAV